MVFFTTVFNRSRRGRKRIKDTRAEQRGDSFVACIFLRIGCSSLDRKFSISVFFLQNQLTAKTHDDKPTCPSTTVTGGRLFVEVFDEPESPWVSAE